MLKHKKEELSLVQLGSHLRIEESLQAQETEKPTIKEVFVPSVNMVEEVKSNNFKGKRKFNEAKKGPNKKVKLTCWTCGMTVHLKRDCWVVKNKNGTSTSGGGQGSKDQYPRQGQFIDFGYNSNLNYVPPIFESFYMQDDDDVWWIDTGASSHVCKNRHWLTSLEPVEDGSVLHMGNESNAPILGRGLVKIEFSSSKIIELLDVLFVPQIRKNLVSDALFDETRFSSIPRTKDLVPSTSVTSEVEEQAIVPTETPMLRRSKRGRIEKSFGPYFQVYLVVGSRDEIGSQFSYCYSIEEDPKSFDEAMKYQDIISGKKQ
ncbi:hypothetical protein L6452_32551 [Arctium lappa]|uniref:Uncharacterized protein n=1 Tax=Arctium lappa TaxID=4217 RepID=A0ACB8Z414_ARCLA|nr:hypothetical protein L6452_32551 [Arctium lappa]